LYDVPRVDAALRAKNELFETKAEDGKVHVYGFLFGREVSFSCALLHAGTSTCKFRSCSWCACLFPTVSAPNTAAAATTLPPAANTGGTSASVDGGYATVPAGTHYYIP